MRRIINISTPTISSSIIITTSIWIADPAVLQLWMRRAHREVLYHHCQSMGHSSKEVRHCHRRQADLRIASLLRYRRSKVPPKVREPDVHYIHPMDRYNHRHRLLLHHRLCPIILHTDRFHNHKDRE